MRLTRSSAILAVIGVLLIVAAALVRFVLIPSATQLPTDLDETLHFEGTYTGLNPSAIDDPNAEPFLTDAAVVASRHVETPDDETDPYVVERTDERAIEGVDDSYSPPIVIDYVMDRETAEASEATDADGNTQDASGLIFTLPYDPQTDGDYTFWDPYSEQATALTYDGEEKKGERDTYKYSSEASTPDGETMSDEVVSQLALPTSIAKDTLVTAGLAIPEGTLNAEQQGQLDAVIAALGELPAEIPLTYISTATFVLYADQELGATVAAENVLVITAQLGGLAEPLAIDFGTFDIKSSSDSIDELSAESADNASKLTLVGTVVPIVALVLGILLVVLALVLASRAGRRPTGGAGSTPPSGGATAASTV